MIRHAASHLDHALTEAQIAYLFERFAARDAFFIESLDLPAELGTVPCGLWGPIMGDPPIGEDGLSAARVSALAGSASVPDTSGAITRARRGTRAWDSRLIDAPTRPTRTVTVIAGPHADVCTRHPECSGRIGSFDRGGGCAEPDYACDACSGRGTVKYACILYTAFGGPLAPQEPGDPGCRDPEASAAFWRDHALAK